MAANTRAAATKERHYAWDVAGSAATGSIAAILGGTTPIAGLVFGIVHKIVYDNVDGCLLAHLDDGVQAKTIRWAIAHFVALAAATFVVVGVFNFQVGFGAELVLSLAMLVHSYALAWFSLACCPCIGWAARCIEGERN